MNNFDVLSCKMQLVLHSFLQSNPINLGGGIGCRHWLVAGELRAGGAAGGGGQPGLLRAAADLHHRHAESGGLLRRPLPDRLQVTRTFIRSLLISHAFVSVQVRIIEMYRNEIE